MTRRGEKVFALSLEVVANAQGLGGGAGRVRAVSETVYQYPLAQQGEFRYVRLRYRGENDQRLMLWRLSVYSHSPDGFFRP